VACREGRAWHFDLTSPSGYDQKRINLPSSTSIAEMGGTDVPYLQDVTTNHTVFHVWDFRGKSRHNEHQSLAGPRQMMV
jgi:hypothetical protein